MRRIFTLESIIILGTILLAGCGSGVNQPPPPPPPASTTMDTQKVVPQKSPLEEDIEKYPFLKFTASEEIIASVNQLTKEQAFRSYKDTEMGNNLEFDEKEIALALKRVTKETSKPLGIGNFTIYSTDNGTFIASKGDPKDKSIFQLPGNWAFQSDYAFTNKHGDLFFYLQSQIVHITSGSKDVDYFEIGKNHWFSDNRRYFANLSGAKGFRIYNIIDLEEMVSSSIEIPESTFTSKRYSPNNFIIGNNGELIIGDGVIEGVGDKWEKEGISYNVFVTGFKAKNAYRATFKGIPLFVNNDYVLFTDQFQMNKISSSGMNAILKYLDFEQLYYELTLEAVSNDPLVGLYGRTYRNRSNQCIFSSEGSFGGDTPAYSFDYSTLTLSKVKFNPKAAKFVKE